MAKRHKWQHHEFKGKDGEYHISFSQCKVCDVKRKTWRYRPDQYQYPTGRTILVGTGYEKTPACCEWHIVLFDSCACTGDIEVFTSVGPEKFISGDKVRCKSCKKIGKMFTDKESTTKYRLQWN